MAGKPTGEATDAVDVEDLGLSFLWHLEAIGLEVADKTGPADLDAMTSARRASRVALIDNGIAGAHPNLPVARSQIRMDFSSSLFGVQYFAPGTSSCTAEENEIFARFIARAVKVYDIDLPKEAMADPFDWLATRRGAGLFPPILKREPPATDDASRRFGAHGTACAGLIAAQAEDADGNPHALPYLGADPQAHVISISTVYSHEYWPVISALLYAEAAGADVIVMPRAMEEMAAPAYEGEHRPDAAADPRHTRFLDCETRWRHKRIFERELHRISSEIPIVVPAGNDGPGPLEYPARLVNAEQNIPSPDLIVVGAVTAFGAHSTYTSGEDGDVTIFAPSDDQEVMSEDAETYDELSWRGRKLFSGVLPERRFCPYGVLAIDIPGRYGYSSDPNDVDELDESGSDILETNKKVTGAQQNKPASLYTLFGGTSAAASITGGVVSRMVRASGGTLTPARIKEIIVETGKEAPDLRLGLGEPKPGRFLNAAAAIAAAYKAAE